MRPKTPDDPCPCGSGKRHRDCRRHAASGLVSGDETQSWQWDGTPAMDAYCVLDRERLAELFAAQPDVVGEKNVWAWIEGLPDDCRSLAVLTATPDGLLIVRTESTVMADQTYEWLVRVCGDVLLTEDGEVVRLGSVAELDRPYDPSGLIH